MTLCCSTQEGVTPLHLAAADGHVSAVAALVAAGVDHDAKRDVRHSVDSPLSVSQAEPH